MIIYFSDKRDSDKRNGSSKSSRRKTPEPKEVSTSKEKNSKSDSTDYAPGSMDKVCCKKLTFIIITLFLSFIIYFIYFTLLIF